VISMSSGPAGAALHAVRAADPVTAAAAAAWFLPGTPPGRQVIGYTLSARAATWIRVRPDGTAEDTRGTGDVFADAYEMVLFDGERELRWLRTPDGLGVAVAVGEDPAGLPAGHDATADPPPRRGDEYKRLLAGIPRPHPAPGWTILDSRRYAAAHLPHTCAGAEVLVVDSIEYLVEDEHGNLDVADTRIVGLRATTPEAVRTATATGPERTTP
jgi:hypothetical protein